MNPENLTNEKQNRKFKKRQTNNKKEYWDELKRIWFELIQNQTDKIQMLHAISGDKTRETDIKVDWLIALIKRSWLANGFWQSDFTC